MSRTLRIASVAGTWLVVILFAWLILVAATRQDITAENTARTRALAERAVAQQKRDACQTAAFRKFPDALFNSANLPRALDYAEDCYRLNGVANAPTIKLP